MLYDKNYNALLCLATVRDGCRRIVSGVKRMKMLVDLYT
jgi:hypothetical protein